MESPFSPSCPTGVIHSSKSSFTLKNANIPVNNQLTHYRGRRRTNFTPVKPRELRMLPEKLVRYGSTRSDRPSRKLTEKRRKEAEILGRRVRFVGEMST